MNLRWCELESYHVEDAATKKIGLEGIQTVLESEYEPPPAERAEGVVAKGVRLDFDIGYGWNLFFF